MLYTVGNGRMMKDMACVEMKADCFNLYKVHMTNIQVIKSKYEMERAQLLKDITNTSNKIS